ncbi:MAG: alpha/beta hydrolase family protein [Caulobacterales bacterium]
MRVWTWGLGLAALGSLTAAAEPPRPADYGAIPTVSDLDLSADGARLLILAPDGDRFVLQIATASVGLTQRRTLIDPQPGIDLLGADWLDSHRALVFEKRAAPLQVSADAPDRIDLYRTSIVDVETGDRVVMLAEKTLDGWDIIAPVLLGRVARTPGKVRVATQEFRLRDMLENRIPPTKEADRFAVFEVDLKTGKGELIERGLHTTRGWLADDQGRLRLRVDADPDKNTTEFWLRNGDTGRLRLLKRWPSLVDVGWSIDGFDPSDPNFAFVTGSFGADKTVIRRIDLRNGRIGPIFAEKPGVDMGGILAENWTNRAVGFAWTDERPRQFYFAPGWAALAQKAEARFPGKTLSFPVESADLRLAVVHVSAPDDPPSAYLMSADGTRFEHLYDEYPQLENRTHGAVRKITYAARDGAQIPAYLTLPPGAVEKNLPLVVMPHGGPQARDEGGFDWWAQFLAARGYAVLQPNFRGSTGYGKAFERAGWKQWGGLMQDDVSDGVAQMVKDGTADPKRVCIIGASYGGFSALAGVTKTPELYACAAAIAGVSDLNLMIRNDLNNVQSDPLTRDWIEAVVAGEVTDKAALDKVSPARHADQVRAPVLLIHGRDDTTVPFAHSEAMRAALVAAGKPVELVELAGEDHYLMKAATRTQMLQALDQFLAKQLGK